MRTVLAVLLLLAGPASAGETCVEGACVATEQTESGAGSCDEGTPYWYEDRALRARVGAEGHEASAMARSECYRTDEPGRHEGYRELLVAADVDGAGATLVWWSLQAGETRACETDVRGAVTLDRGCPLGPPPMLPALP